MELETVFRVAFRLDQLPRIATLRVAAFRSAVVSINGNSPGITLRPSNWKAPVDIDVASQLRKGENALAVTVSNSNGPPALWLELDAEGIVTCTDGRWEASYAGADWLPARPASDLNYPPPEAMVHRGEPSLATCLRRQGWLLVLYAALAAAISSLLARHPDSSAVASLTTWRAWLPVAVPGVMWAALFANNLGCLFPEQGFDVSGHIAYIQYIQTQHALPAPAEGWEMFQPPLYYLLCASVLDLLGLSISSGAGLVAARFIGLAIGVAHCAVVWAALRLLFPGERLKPFWGATMAVCLAPMLYLSQFITNEAMAAALVSFCVYVCLRLLRKAQVSWRDCVLLGLCLGAAFLTKSTALLAVPASVGALLWRWLERRSISPAAALGRSVVIIVVCMAVAGWHYARLWIHYGSPFIGVWDPRLGAHWWQDDGYRTASFYFRFGGVFLHPWFGAWRSFGDGIYSTLWGDGLVSSAGDFFSRPGWNYDLMTIGFWLAVVPSIAIVLGCFMAIQRFIREPSPEWFLILGLGFLVSAAVVYMTLSVPYYCMVKAFYGLAGITPLCAMGALGLAWAARGVVSRAVCGTLLGIWAITSYASFWMQHNSDPVIVQRADVLLSNHRNQEAIQLLQDHLQVRPLNANFQTALCHALARSGDLEGAARQAQALMAEHPEDCRGFYLLAKALVEERRYPAALNVARRAVELAPDYVVGREQLALLLTRLGRFDEAIAVSRKGLGNSPCSSTLRFALGASLLGKGESAESTVQLHRASLLSPNWAEGHLLLGNICSSTGQNAAAAAEYSAAVEVEPDSVGALNNLAWIRAASPQAELRDGTQAVGLAEHACALTGYQRPILLGTLAAAYAETGRFADAIATAQKAQNLAVAKGDDALAAKSRSMIKLFEQRQPYRIGETESRKSGP